MKVPAFGVGTFRLQGDVVKQSVKNALEVGYRVVDTAQIYGNESEIGDVLSSSGIPRNQLFLTTKIWVDNLAKGQLLPSLKTSLKKLNTDYVDLTLIHWPGKGANLQDYMTELLEAKNQGLTKAIGVSNFTIDLLQQAIAVVGRENITTNQIELSPYLQNRNLVAFMKDNGIQVTSYMTLAYGKTLSDPVIVDIASRYLASPAQIVLAWALAKGYSVIPSSTKREHLAGNLAAQTLILSADDIARIDTLECNGRLTDPDGLAPEWD